MIALFKFVAANRRVFAEGPRPTWIGADALICAALLCAPVHAYAEGPDPATLAAWDAYVKAADARIEAAAAQQGSDHGMTPTARAALARGEVLVNEALEPAPGHEGVDVPDGRIHHWRGRVFVPNVSLDRLIAAVREPAAHKQEDVLDARLLERTGDTDRVFLKITRSSLVTATYNTEHTVTYRTVGRDCVVSRSVATKIAEIEGLGTPAEREKPPGTDRGFLWRMNAYWRYEAAADGVMVTLESITLSRDVPWALSPIASPIVNRVARESVVRTLRSLRARF